MKLIGLFAVVVGLSIPWMPCAPCSAQTQPSVEKQLYDRVAPSLVVIQYVWETELGRREVIGAGVVVGKEGLVLTHISVFDLRIPDDQMKDFRILRPQADAAPQEFEAVFLGRDERTDMALLKTKQPQDWTAIEFVDEPLDVGEHLLSVGLMPKDAGYRAYLTEAAVAAQLRGEVPFVLVSGELGTTGSAVFDEQGRAVGIVGGQPGSTPFLNDQQSLPTVLNSPPRLFVPTRDFALSLSNPPAEGQPLKMPWLGIPQQAMAGLQKDVAELLGLGDQTAIELGDILAGSPASKAGLRAGDVVVMVNGQPIPRGDDPTELPGIFVRLIRRLPIGQPVTLTIRRGQDPAPQEVAVVLEERPRSPGQVRRYWAEDLGFGVRELTFGDTYLRRLAADAPGVVVTLLKPNGSAASADLQPGDLISELNGQSVKNLDQFRELYEQVRKVKPADAVVLIALREANTQVIRIEPPQ
jgi:S1-C subfamily serine protease